MAAPQPAPLAVVDGESPLCAALYLRVSTGRQAESDLSIPDQRRQATAFCKAEGWSVVTEFVDAGLTGTDDNRPQLHRLLHIAQVALTRAAAAAELSPEARTTSTKMAVAVKAMRASILEGDILFRPAYLRAMIDNVEVNNKEVRIYGRRTVLERLVMGDGIALAGVPRFVRKWRTRRASNCWPQIRNLLDRFTPP